jgi:hypothetical protein
MSKKLVGLIAATLLSLGAVAAYAQGGSAPSENNPNPASSSSTDDAGANPLAREGEHSPTGHNAGTTPPQTPSTTGSRPGEAGQAPSRSNNSSGTGTGSEPRPK